MLLCNPLGSLVFWFLLSFVLGFALGQMFSIITLVKKICGKH